ncbi:hypothetical protein OFN64_37205, partial [Escherichia coli]|nr:hypothetical protein [Escherichia coli]
PQPWKRSGGSPCLTGIAGGRFREQAVAAGVVIAVVFALNAAGLLSYGEYVDAADMLGKHPVLSPIFTLYLAVVWIYFFVFFWTR